MKMAKLKKGFASLLSLVLIATTINNNVLQVKAASIDEIAVTGSYKYVGTDSSKRPSNFSIIIQVYDDMACNNPTMTAEATSKFIQAEHTITSAEQETLPDTFKVGGIDLTNKYLKISIVTAGKELVKSKIDEADVSLTDFSFVKQITTNSPIVIDFEINEPTAGGGETGPNPGDIDFNIRNSQNGKVYYSKDNKAHWDEVSARFVRKEALSVENGTEIYIKAEPNAGQSIDNTEGINVIAIDGSRTPVNVDNLLAGDVHFTYDNSKKYGVEVEFRGRPGPGPEGGQGPEGEPEPDVIDITVNGTPYTDVKDGYVIKGDFNLDELTYSITKVNGTAVTNVGNKSGVKDDQGRDVLEIQVKAKSDSSLTLALIYHSEDDKANPGQPGFYIKNLTFAKEGFVGVSLDIGKVPDMYDDTVYSSVIDITGTTQAAPAKTAAYYGSEEIDLASVDAGKAITKIEVASGTNPGAVTITGSKVKFNSPFYASIPLVVTLDDGTKGYLQVDRLGLELGAYNKDAETLHGSQPGLSLAGVSGTAEKNIVATFYYDAANAYTDYDIVANITYANGKTETKVVKGFGEKECNDPSLKGGDYLVWSGAKEDTPVSVSVTAVKANATTGNTFGGACFGAGAGLTKSFAE